MNFYLILRVTGIWLIGFPHFDVSAKVLNFTDAISFCHQRCSPLHSDYFGEDNADPENVIYIGKEREYKSLYEFFQSAGEISNAHIIVDPGDYYAEEIWVIGTNLVIEGKGKVNLYCSSLHQNVMWVSGSHITIRNFHMTHKSPGTIENNNCTGRVLAFDNANFVTIEHCDLNGCGLAGLHDNVGNSNITIKKNYIHNNSVGAYTDIDGNVWFREINDHPVFTFIDNRMRKNGPGHEKGRAKKNDSMFEGE